MNVLLDLDGVVWLGDEVVPGSPEAVKALRGRGDRVIFFTNNSCPSLDEHLTKLSRMGISCTCDDLLTSAQAAAVLVERGSTALVLGGEGIIEALRARGAEPIQPHGGPVSGRAVPDTVVVGLDKQFNFDALSRAVTAVRGGARLIATNDDATFPGPDGLLPGAGALVAAVVCAGGSEALVAGKPYGPSAQLLAARIGTVDLVIGDRPSTDGAFARRLGARFGLVLSGVTPRGHGPVEPHPDIEADDLANLVAKLGTT